MQTTETQALTIFQFLAKEESEVYILYGDKNRPAHMLHNTQPICGYCMHVNSVHVAGSIAWFSSTSKSVQTNWLLDSLCDAVGPVAAHSIVTVPPALTVTPLLIKCAVQISRTSVNM